MQWEKKTQKEWKLWARMILWFKTKNLACLEATLVQNYKRPTHGSEVHTTSVGKSYPVAFMATAAGSARACSRCWRAANASSMITLSAICSFKVLPSPPNLFSTLQPLFLGSRGFVRECGGVLTAHQGVVTSDWVLGRCGGRSNIGLGHEPESIFSADH